MRRWVVIGVGIVVFVAISVVLARWLTVDNAERDRVETLLRAQAAGDGAALARDIDGCSADPACVARMAKQARQLRTSGRVEIVAYDSATSHALGPKDGPTRVVWKTPSRLTTVQCVAIRRTGNVLSGASVTVTALSEPIGRQAGC
jgi:hypothetical protein